MIRSSNYVLLSTAQLNSKARRQVVLLGRAVCCEQLIRHPRGTERKIVRAGRDLMGVRWVISRLFTTLPTRFSETTTCPMRFRVGSGGFRLGKLRPVKRLGPRKRKPLDMIRFPKVLCSAWLSGSVPISDGSVCLNKQFTPLSLKISSFNF